MAKKQNTKKPVRVTTFADNAKIVVVNKDYAPREGTYIANVWSLVTKSKTIAAYRAARKRAKLGDGLGGMLAGFVNAGHVRIAAGK